MSDASDVPEAETHERSRRATTPEQTRDDTDEGWGDWRDREDRDHWLKEQRPPHWD